MRTVHSSSTLGLGKAAVLAVCLALLVTACSAQGLASKRQEKRLLDCTLEAKSIDDCDPVAYGIRLAVFSAPGLVLAVFYVLCCPVYCGGKYCCNCCGGRNQAPNFCCPNEELPARYSTGDLVRPRVFAILCLATSIAALIWGTIGIDALTKGLNGAGDVIEGTPDTLTNLIVDIDQALTVDLYDLATTSLRTTSLFNGTSLSVEAYKLRDEFQSMVDDNMGSYRDQIQDVRSGLYVAFTLPVVFLFFGWFFSLCSIRKYLPMMIVWLLFLIGIVIWLAHAVFCLTSMLLGDVCAEINGLANKQMNVIAPILQCKDSNFADFRNSFKALEVQRAEETCTGLALQCYNEARTADQNARATPPTVYVCPVVLNCTGITFSQLLTYTKTAFYIDPRIEALPEAGTSCMNRAVNPFTKDTTSRCYMSDCAENCVQLSGQLSHVGQYATDQYYNFLAARAVSNALDTVGARFSSCDAVFDLIISPFALPCDDLTKGTVYGRQASGLLGLCSLGGIFIYAWGAKRFLGLDEAERPQSETEVKKIKDGDLDD